MNDWYNHAIIYQIYPKSFQDSNGDGIGDLNGIRQRIPYLKRLGITAVWLNPIFVSPQVDNGYDVANYFAIDESMGTMADMDALINDFHAAGIRIILDFVLNHTSDQHPWFQDAVTSKDSIYRDYYLFAGSGNHRPNNWGSFFGGSVWSPDPAGSGQSYFHLFDQKMPDLNWANPEVRRSMGDVAEFWLKKGIDGLRLDAFIHIAKADLYQNYPVLGGDNKPVVAEPFFANLPKVQEWLRPFCSRIRTDYPNVFLLGEAASANVNLAADYTNQQSKLMDAVITFRYFTDDESKLNSNIPAQYQPKAMDWFEFKRTQVVWQETLKSVSLPVLYWGNHDMARVATRIAENTTQARSLALLMYLQRGIPIIYYGDELGLHNLKFQNVGDFNDETVASFVSKCVEAGMSQDEALAMASLVHKLPARGLMPWDDSDNHGFSRHTPWIHGREVDTTDVFSQIHDKDSMFHFYQQLIDLKKQPLFEDGDYRLIDTSGQVYAYSRKLGSKAAIVMVSLSGDQCTVTMPYHQYRRMMSVGDYELQGQEITLGAYAGVVLEQVKGE
ncbi:alpha-glucosidase [Lacticaseibacillus pantheris]|nr:alpha-glucosidase [Lacticaseibacillus pantheris]